MKSIKKRIEFCRRQISEMAQDLRTHLELLTPAVRAWVERRLP